MPKLLIDGDILLYRCAFSSEETFDWGDDMVSVSCDMRQATQELENKLREIKRTVGPGFEPIVCLSHKENWRKEVYPEYKHNRTATRKPVGLQRLRDHLADEHETAVWPRLEADDIMGMLATADPGSVIASADKDMLGVPCLLFNPEKDIRPQEVSVEEADYWHAIQSLTGDSTDGYPGCPGIGPKKAEAALQKIPRRPAELWAAVLGVYLKNGHTVEEATVQATLARILRTGEWDKMNCKPLWRPGK